MIQEPSLKRIHWSNESRFLLNHVDGRVRVWRERTLNINNVNRTFVYVGGGMLCIWDCLSNGCKLLSQVIDGTLYSKIPKWHIGQSCLPMLWIMHLKTDQCSKMTWPHRAQIVRNFFKQSPLKHFYGPWSNMFGILLVVNSIKHNRNIKTQMHYWSFLLPFGTDFHSIGLGVWSSEWGCVIIMYIGSAGVIPDTNDLNVNWHFMYF